MLLLLASHKINTKFISSLSYIPLQDYIIFLKVLIVISRLFFYIFFSNMAYFVWECLATTLFCTSSDISKTHIFFPLGIINDYKEMYREDILLRWNKRVNIYF